MEIPPEFDVLALPFQGHSTTITKITYDHDEEELITGGMDGTIRIWNPLTKRQKIVFTAHHDYISQLILLSPKKQLISSSWDGKIIFWDLKQKRIAKIFDNSKPILDMVISPSKQFLLISSEGKKTKLINTETGKQISSLKGHKDEISVLSFSPDGKSFVSGSWDKTVKIWDLESKRPLNTIYLENEVSAISFLDPFKIIIGTWNGNVFLYDLEMQNITKKTKLHYNIVSQILFDKKNNYILTVSADKTIKIVDPITLEEKYSLEDHKSRIFSIAISKDYIFSAGADKKIAIWDRRTLKKADEILGRDNTVFQALLTPTAEYAQVLDSSGNETFIDLKTLEIVSKPNVPFYSKEKLKGIMPIIIGHDGVSVRFNLKKLTSEQAKLAFVSLKATIAKKYWVHINDHVYANLSQNQEISDNYYQKTEMLFKALKKRFQ